MTQWGKQALEEEAFEQALIQALAQVEAEPPMFQIPSEIEIPQALVRSIRQVEKALDTSRSAMRLAFSFVF